MLGVTGAGVTGAGVTGAGDLGTSKSEVDSTAAVYTQVKVNYLKDVNRTFQEVKNNYRIRGTTPEIEQAARKLRNNLTPAESRLWQVLRNKQFEGLRFHCQHPVGNFILDFYCPSCKLVVEVDGEIHACQTEYDDARTAKLAEYGYKVLRFTNEQVINDLPTVLAEIRRVVLLPPSPPILGGKDFKVPHSWGI